MLRVLLFTGSALLFISCGKQQEGADAYGNFEATEITVSAQGNGPLLAFTVNEGDALQQGQTVGLIDTLPLYLKKQQVQAQIRALRGQVPDAAVQLEVLSQQMAHAEQEQARIGNLLAGGAATPQQRDDIVAQVNLLKKRYASLESSLSVQTRSILAQIKPLQVQIAQLDDQLGRCRIINPVNGTVLLQYAEPNEVVSYGRPLYKIADLSQMILRAYISGSQLPRVKIGQQVTVRTDTAGGYQVWKGRITWISGESEFTPKQIQTKEERVNLVYAVKIAVQSNGTLKIGMPGEVVF